MTASVGPADQSPVALLRRVADYAMSMDLLSRLAAEDTSRGVVRALLDLVGQLCAPEAALFVPTNRAVPETLLGLPDEDTARARTEAVLGRLEEGSDWALTDDGLAVRIRRDDVDLGVLAVSGLTVTGRRDDYLNLLLAARGVIALALANARTHELLVEREARYRLLAENATDLVLLTDATGEVRWVSPSVVRVLGYQPDEVIGSRADALVHPADRGPEGAAFHGPTAVSGTGDGVVRIRTRDRGYRWMAVHVAAVDPDATGAGRATRSGVVVGLRDVDDLVLARQQAEEAVRAERLTRMSIDSAAIAMALLETDGTIRTVNPALCRLLGYSAAELRGRRFTDLAHSGDRPDDLTFLQELVRGEDQILQRRVRSLRSSGEVVWGDLSLTLISGEGIDADTLVAQIVDVTAEVRTTEALQRSMKRFQLLAENASDIVYQTDTQGFVEWVSPSIRTVLGWDPDVIAGTSTHALTHPDDIPVLDSGRDEAVSSTRVGTAVVRFRATDGSYRWVSVKKRPILDPHGRVTGIVAGVRDVTEERAVREELERRERQFRLAMDGAPQGMALCDPDGVLVEVNPALARLLGASSEALVGTAVIDLVHPDDREELLSLREELLSGRTDTARAQHRLVHGGREVWVEHSMSLTRDSAGAPRQFVHQLSDETADRELRAELAFRASHDVLTGLSNRQALMDRLGAQLTAGTHDPQTLGVVFCDVDNLKPINDVHGHLAGDAVLSTVAERLAGAVRDSDLVGRVGGDEFVILLDHASDLDALQRVAEKVHEAVSRPVDVDGEAIPLTVSLGVTVARASESADSVLERADRALYAAKQSGRDRVHVEPPD